MARNWLRAFRPATFRGVAFEVDIESASGARRLSISPIAYAETSVIEDMGRDPRAFSIRAYVVGDSADSRAALFMSMLDRKDPGMLVLPMLAPLRARVIQWSLRREKDYAGHIAFDIEFIEEGLGAVPFGNGGAAGVLGDLMATASILVGAVFVLAMAGSKRQSAADAAVEAQARFTSVQSLTTPSTPGAKLIQGATVEFSQSVLQIGSQPSRSGVAMVTAWRQLALHGEPRDLKSLISTELSALATQIPETSAAAEIKSTEGACMVAALAIAGVRDQYPARQDASAERERLSLYAGPVLETMGDRVGAELLDWLSNLTGQAALSLSRQSATQAPLVRVETGVFLSATRAAFELYGDANRAAEIVDRNRVPTPAIMPTRFEALAE